MGKVNEDKGQVEASDYELVGLEERWTAKHDTSKKSEKKKSGGKHEAGKESKEPKKQPSQSSKSSSSSSPGKEKGQRLHVPWRRKLLRWWRHAVPRLRKA